MKNANIEIHLQDLDFPIQLSKKEKIEKLKERILEQPKNFYNLK